MKTIRPFTGHTSQTVSNNEKQSNTRQKYKTYCLAAEIATEPHIQMHYKIMYKNAFAKANSIRPNAYLWRNMPSNYCIK